MQKIYFLFIFIFLSLFVKADDKFKIVASASMLADMAENIIGAEDEVVQCIVPIGGDPHLHEPTPADAKLVADADLILVNGLTFDGWVEKLIKSSGSKAKVITVADGITPISSDDYDNATDPHAWMDVTKVYTYIKNIKNAMVELRPDNKEMYEFNYGVYLQTLKDLDKYALEEIKKIPEKSRILITSHDAFKYFGRRYGLRLESVVGVSTEAEAQTADVVRLNKIIKKNNIPALFIESTINPKLLKELAKSNDVSIGGELFADSLGPKDGEAGTFVNMIKYNVNTIVNALSKSKEENKATETVDTGESSSTTNYITWGILALLLLGGFGFVFSRLSK